MSSSMRNFLEAYSAVHNTEAKEEFYSQRDLISEMNTASLTDNDLREIAEEICEELFSKGYKIQEAADILSEILSEGDNAGRNAKLSRLFDAFAETFNRIQSKANQLEAFAQYRNSKRLQETWSARFNQEKRIKRHHNALVAEDVSGVKKGLLQMVELHSQKENEVTEGKKAKPDYLDFDGDGNEKESMKKALKDKKKVKEELEATGKFSEQEIEALIEKI
jgi:hypothetical protein